jgi:hypothetical protein
MKAYNVVLFGLMLGILASCSRSNFASFQPSSPEVVSVEPRQEIVPKIKIEAKRIPSHENLDFSKPVNAKPLEIPAEDLNRTPRDIKRQIKKKERIFTYIESSKFLSKIATKDSLSKETKLLKNARISKTMGLISIGLILATALTLSHFIASFFLIFGLLASIFSFFIGLGPLLKLPKGKKKMAAIGVISSVLFYVLLVGVIAILVSGSVPD